MRGTGYDSGTVDTDGRRSGTGYSPDVSVDGEVIGVL